MLMAFISYSSHLSISTFLIFLLFSFPHFSAKTPSPHYLKLPLLHKNPNPPTPSEALSADNRRLSTLFSALRHHHPKLPVTSAASFGSGQYLVSLHLGTPPQRVSLIADTGSDLTWVSCSACRRRCSPRATSFFPRFGCGFWNSGPSVSGPSINGVLGLGRGPISFSSQLGREFGHKFSYCLMDYSLPPPPTSYLLIGGGSANGAVPKAKFSYTPLLKNPLSPTFYYIGIESVIINDVKLRISPSVWAIDEFGNGGTVLDSGTTLTFLAEPAYRRILAVFERLVKLPRPAEPTVGFDLCLNVSGSALPSLPQLSFQLGGDSVFSPPPRNYFIDTSDGVKCLALQPVTSVAGFSVIGNLMQQGYTFEFDKDRSRLGFTRHGCAVP